MQRYSDRLTEPLMAEEGSYDLMVNGEEIGMPLRQLNHNGGGAAMPNSKG